VLLSGTFSAQPVHYVLCRNLPEKSAVIAITVNIGDMQAELNLAWKYLLPALKIGKRQ